MNRPILKTNDSSILETNEIDSERSFIITQPLEDNEENRNKLNKKLIPGSILCDQDRIYNFSDIKYYFLKKADCRIINNGSNPYCFIYEHDSFTEEDEENCIVIIFIGKTGHGKTTFINALFNILFGVKIYYKFRYNLIYEDKKSCQGESQTNGIHIHNIKLTDGTPLKIIDTQGFGDTRGFNFDETIINNFYYLFKNQIKYINAICLIINSTEERITSEQNYLFTRLASLFSKEIAKNFIICCTNYSGYGIPKAFCSLYNYEKPEENISILTPIIRQIEEPKYFKFESKNILIDPGENIDKGYKNLRKMAWKITKANMIDLLNEKFFNLDKRNITDSTKVLEIRKSIDEFVFSCINFMKEIVSKNNEISADDSQIKNFETEIDNIRNNIKNLESDISQQNNEINSLRSNIDELQYQYNLKQYTHVSRSRTLSRPVTKRENSSYEHKNCTICSETCHKYCNCWFWCDAMSNGRCIYCHHRESAHVKTHYYFYKTTEDYTDYYTEIVDTRSPYDWEVTEIDNKKKCVETKISSLNTLKDTKKNLEEKINSLNNQIDAQKKEIKDILSKIEILKFNFTEKIKNIKELNNELLEKALPVDVDDNIEKYLEIVIRRNESTENKKDVSLTNKYYFIKIKKMIYNLKNEEINNAFDNDLFLCDFKKFIKNMN